MSEQKIIIRANEKGELSVETKGIHGPTCVDEINKLLDEIAFITDRKNTDEYYMKGTVKAQSNVKVGLK